MNHPIEITKVYNYSDVWNALVGSDFVGLSHWIESLDCDWEKKYEEFPVTHLSQDDETSVTTIVTSGMIVDGFKKAVIEDETHCGGCRISDLENPDSCFADVILQYAIFGELVFG